MTELLLVKLQVMFSIFINEKLERGFHYKFFVSFQWSYYLEELKTNSLIWLARPEATNQSFS